MIKKFIILALVALVCFLLVKYIPEMIHKERKAQTEQYNNMQLEAERKAGDMVGSGPNRVDRAIGGQWGDKAMKNADKASRRSMETLRQMEEQENQGNRDEDR
ncbi:MAG TPA: hypothetical protein VM658_01000 [bacterium]|nr:hypothetical protein [bacterium]